MLTLSETCVVEVHEGSLILRVIRVRSRPYEVALASKTKVLSSEKNNDEKARLLSHDTRDQNCKQASRGMLL